jgi:DNA-binding Lrp family transcriptional regulator
LTEEQLKVLKGMNEITNRIDMNSFAQMVGLSPNQTIDYVQELVNSGLVRKTGGGYGITEKGKAVLKAITPVTQDNVFHFYTEVGQPTGSSATSLKEFYNVIKYAAEKSLEFHLYRGDFENWIKASVEDAELADELTNLKSANLNGEKLRKAIITAIAKKYGFQ